MMKHNKLAIIIPAYKTHFLHKTFKCISSQTCKDFNLYVFDDNSPYDIKKIYDEYFSNWTNSHYHKFKDNLGGKNLAQHWQRCVDNSGTEEWVWLFSDDDLMTQNCVEQFYNAISNSNNIIGDVMHFDIQQIDDDGNIEEVMPPYPQNISAMDYFCLLHKGKLDTRMPEFIFRRKKLKEIGGYISFDLAWKSDNATVTAMTYPGTIFTIPNGLVSWRLSNNNVTGANMDHIGIERKRKATIDFFNWNYIFFKNRNVDMPMSKDDLFEVYFNYSFGYWIYNARLYDVIAFSRQFEATKSCLDKVLFLKYWLKATFKLTRRRDYFKRILIILTEWKMRKTL